MKRILQSIAILSILLLGSTDIAAQGELKIGYVDPQVILARMPETAAVTQRLQNFSQRKQQELTQKEQTFQTEVANYQQKAGVISDDAKAKEEERLGQLEVELISFRDTAQKDIQAKQAELVGPLLQQIQVAIDAVAKAKGLSFVLNTTTSTGDVIILYASDEIRQNYDITEAVMQELNIFE